MDISQLHLLECSLVAGQDAAAAAIENSIQRRRVKAATGQQEPSAVVNAAKSPECGNEIPLGDVEGAQSIQGRSKSQDKAYAQVAASLRRGLVSAA